jgi:hypothetical protein
MEAHEENSPPLPLIPPRFSQEVTRDWTRASAVRNQRLTAWTKYDTTWVLIFMIMFSLICKFSECFPEILHEVYIRAPITVAERFKAWTVFARLNAGIMCFSPTEGVNVYLRLFCVCVDSGLVTGWSPVQGVLRIVLGSRNWSEKKSVSRMPYAPKWEQQEKYIYT